MARRRRKSTRKRHVLLGRRRKRVVKRHRVNRKRLPSGAAFARVIARKVKNKYRRLMSLRPAGGADHDELLIDMVRQARKSGGYLSTEDRVDLQDKIHSANRHGMSNKDAEELLKHLNRIGRK